MRENAPLDDRADLVPELSTAPGPAEIVHRSARG